MKSKLIISGAIISCILLIVFIFLAVNISSIEGGIYFDQRIISFIHESINPAIKGLMVVISFLGSAKFYFIIMPFLIWLLIKRKHRIELYALLISLLGSYGLNEALKAFFGRHRPYEYFLVQQKGFSFPSGHAMITLCFYGMAAYLYLRNRKLDLKKVLIWIVTIVFIGLTGFSRIYLGVHWPTDIIAGFSAGFIWLYLCIFGVEIAHKKIIQKTARL